MSEIEKLEYPEIVRRRPGMFIGSVANPKVILREATDNAIDMLYRRKETNLIIVDVNSNYCLVQDNGGGIPIIWDDKYKCTKTQLAVANLYAGSNFSKDENNQAIGQHGVGVACTNALSTKFLILSRINKNNYNKSIPEVKSLWESSKDKSNLFYFIEFSRGNKVEEGADLLGHLAEKHDIKFDNRCDTMVYFTPDPDIFESVTDIPIPYENFTYLGLIMERYYKRKVSLVINGEEYYKNFEPYKFEFSCTIPLFESEEAYTEAYNKGVQVNKPINKNVWFYSTFEFNDDINVSSYEGSINSLVVNMGTHIQMINNAINQSLEKVFDTNSPNLIKGLKVKTVLVCAETIFDAQTKTKLVEIPGANSFDLSYYKLPRYIEPIIKRNRDYFLDHVNKIDTFNVMNQQLSSKKFVKQIVNSKAGTRFNASSIRRLRDASSEVRKECELFLVEGNSAGSTMVDVRNPKIHAILPLKGRPLNTTVLTLEEMLKNEEMKDIILSIGAGVNGMDKVKQCRYGKIICSADADPDGGCITASLLAFFATHCTSLITEGKVFVALSPLYIQNGKYIYPGDEDQLDKNKPFRRIKGLITRPSNQ